MSPTPGYAVHIEAVVGDLLPLHRGLTIELLGVRGVLVDVAIGTTPMTADTAAVTLWRPDSPDPFTTLQMHRSTTAVYGEWGHPMRPPVPHVYHAVSMEPGGLDQSQSHLVDVGIADSLGAAQELLDERTDRLRADAPPGPWGSGAVGGHPIGTTGTVEWRRYMHFVGTEHDEGQWQQVRVVPIATSRSARR